MNSQTCTRIIAVTLFATLAIPVRPAAQDKQDQHNMHHHYTLIDMGTFGGPNSYLESFPPENIINLRGATAGFADTLVPDPYAPNCAVSECLVVHAFVWKQGALTDLGSLPSGYSSFASSINTRGDIVGASQNGQIDPLTAYPANDAVLWRNGVINDLGTLGGSQSVGNAINDSGHVAGAALNTIPDPLANAFSLLFMFVPAATQAHAFRWTEADGMLDLGTLGGPDSTAAFVNQLGQIAGQSYTNATINPATGYATLDPFFWENGIMVDIGTLGGTFGYPNWMNSRGQVTGVSDTAGDQSVHAFLWDQHHKPPLTDLGDLGGGYSYANWINDAGEIVGVSSTLTAEDAFLWKNGVMIDLGSLAGDPCNEALSINSQGQIVGFGSADCFSESQAFLSENGGPLIELQSLVSPGSGVTLTEGIFINDRGEIAALGKLSNGDEHAIVLIPCDQQHHGIEGCDYSLVHATAAAHTPQVTQARSVPMQNGIPIGLKGRLASGMARRYHMPGGLNVSDR